MILIDNLSRWLARLVFKSTPTSKHKHDTSSDAAFEASAKLGEKPNEDENTLRMDDSPPGCKARWWA